MAISKKQKPHIISLFSTKGGVGKTSLAASLGGFLASKQLQVLYIDGDVQPSLTNYYVISEKSPSGLKKFITEPDSNPTDYISVIDENQHIIVSDDPNGTLHKWVLETPDGRFRLKNKLENHPHFQQYDYIIIDTQGAVGALQEAILFASHQIVSPVVADKISGTEFVDNSIRTINRLAESANFMKLSLAPVWGVFNKTNKTSDNQFYRDDLQEMHLNDACKVPFYFSQTQVPELAAYKEAASLGIPVHKMRSRTKAPSGLETMSDLAHELGLIEKDGE